MSSRSLAAIAKSPQQLADALVSMTSAERFAAIKQGYKFNRKNDDDNVFYNGLAETKINSIGITAADLAAAIASCPPEQMLAIFHDLPDDIPFGQEFGDCIKVGVLVALPDIVRKQLVAMLSPEQVAAVVRKCSEEERRPIALSMDHDLMKLAVVVNLLDDEEGSSSIEPSERAPEVRERERECS
jgi:hypothetical protein